MIEPIVIKITTEDLFHNYINSARDVAWDCRSDTSIEESLQFNLLNALMQGKIVPIRKAFNDGYTCMLMGKKMDIIVAIHHKVPPTDKTDMVHIRITHEGDVIGELVDAEIKY